MTAKEQTQNKPETYKGLGKRFQCLSIDVLKII